MEILFEVATKASGHDIKDSRPNESCCDKRKVVETEKEFQRKILSRHIKKTTLVTTDN